MGYLDKDGLSRAFTKLKTLIDKKADVGHSHTKNQVGLGNVDNTADANKSVKYASSAGYASSATNANGIVVSDTRNDNSAPNNAAFDKHMLTADFKYGSTIGSPTGFKGTYCGVLSFAPWSQTSGGHGYQLAFGYEKEGHPRLALRGSDLSATSWNSWYKVYTSDDKPTLSELGAAAASHSHTKSQITDFPTSMPASDVYSWAKASTKPTYTKSEVGLGNVDNTADAAKSVKYATSAGSATSASKLSTARKLKVNLTGANAQSFDGSADAQSIGVSGKLAIVNGGTGADSINGIRTNIGINAVTTGGTGAAYTATVNGITSLTAGRSFIMVPHVTSTTTAPTLNVGGLGAKNIRMRLSSNTSSTIQLIRSDFLVANNPVKVVYDGTYWVLDDFVQPDANHLYGTLISRGTSAPSNSTGGFIYIQTT